MGYLCCWTTLQTPLSSTVRIVCVLVMMSYVGCIVRMALAAVSDSIVEHGGFEYAAAYRDSIANMVGCAIMGFMVTQGSIVAGTPLFVGITTGMCGCITTFSGWVATVACEMAVPKYATAVMCAIFGWCSSVGFYAFGRHCGELVNQKEKNMLDYQHSRVVCLPILVCLSLFLAFSAFLAAAITWYFDHFTRRYWFALAICPAGTIVRWAFSLVATGILSRVEVPPAASPQSTESPCIESDDGETPNLSESDSPDKVDPAPQIRPSFIWQSKPLVLWKSSKVPIQTFAANILACILYALVMKPASKTPATYITTESGNPAQDWAWAIAVGFCGCCSTVSTLVHESAGTASSAGGGMRRWVTYLYCTTSVVVGVCTILPAALTSSCAGKEPS